MYIWHVYHVYIENMHLDEYGMVLKDGQVSVRMFGL